MKTEYHFFLSEPMGEVGWIYQLLNRFILFEDQYNVSPNKLVCSLAFYDYVQELAADQWLDKIYENGKIQQAKLIVDNDSQDWEFTLVYEESSLDFFRKTLFGFGYNE